MSKNGLFWTWPTEQNIETLRKDYPKGARVRLTKMDDKHAPPIGTLGTVRGVDDIGSILVDWDNGSRLNVALGEDLCEVVDCPRMFEVGYVDGHDHKYHTRVVKADSEEDAKRVVVLSNLEDWIPGYTSFEHSVVSCRELSEKEIKEFQKDKQNLPSGVKVELFGTITSYSDGTISLEYLELPPDIMNKVWELVEPHCSGSVRGTPEEVAEEVSKI